jgi:hypothetical protein
VQRFVSLLVDGREGCKCSVHGTMGLVMGRGVVEEEEDEEAEGEKKMG